MADHQKGIKPDKPVAGDENEFESAMALSDGVDQRERMKRWEELQKFQELSFESNQITSRRAEVMESAAAKWDKYISEACAAADTGVSRPEQVATIDEQLTTEQRAAGAKQLSMTDEIKLLQSEQQELQKLTNNAIARVLIDPEGTYVALQGALPSSDSWTERMLDWQRRSHASEKSTLLLTMGQAAFLLGKLHDARHAFEQASSLPMEASAKAFVAEQMGQLEMMEGSFSAAEQHFDEAHKAYVTDRQWEYAARTLGEQAQCAYQQGNRLDYLGRLDDAIGFAKEHLLGDWERNLALTKLKFQLIVDSTDEPIEKLIDYHNRRNALELDKADVEELAADYWTAHGLIEAAIKRLRKAEERARIEAAKETPELIWEQAQQRAGKSIDAKSWIHKHCTLLQKLSDLYLSSPNPSDDDIQNAIQCATESARIAKELHHPMLIRPALSSLVRSLSASGRIENRERAEQSLDELRNLGPSEELAHALLARADAQFKDHGSDPALQAIAQAEQCAAAVGSLDLRRLALTARTVVLGSAGSLDEALDANKRALDLFNEQKVASGKPALTASSDWLSGIDALSGNAAMLLARLGRISEGFEYAENGKARRLRAELAQVGLADGRDRVSSVTVHFDELRNILSTENAAMAMFWSGFQKTLILIMTPTCEQPKAVLIDLSADELKALVPATNAVVDQPWAADLLKALSQKFVPPALQNVIQDPTIRVLYLVLDPRLYSLPFAALQMQDGSPLIKHCALAYAPSGGTAKWCLSRTSRDNQRRYLVVGIGKENGTSFARQAEEISNFIGHEAQLLPESEASVERFWELAPQFTVLHLSCHGQLDTSVPASLLASRLEFNGGALSAKRVFEHEGQLRADLVFLNACRSGLFNAQRSREIGGFWEGFLHAGVPSVVATVRSVDPNFAHRLVLKFYDAWMRDGVSKAEALRRAQFAMYQAGVEPRHWASHVLVGAHR